MPSVCLKKETKRPKRVGKGVLHHNSIIFVCLVSKWNYSLGRIRQAFQRVSADTHTLYIRYQVWSVKGVRGSNKNPIHSRSLCFLEEKLKALAILMYLHLYSSVVVDAVWKQLQDNLIWLLVERKANRQVLLNIVNLSWIQKDGVGGKLCRLGRAKARSRKIYNPIMFI